MEVDRIWQPYLDALEKTATAVKLTAFHTNEAAHHTRRTVLYAKRTSEHIGDYLEGIHHGQG